MHSLPYDKKAVDEDESCTLTDFLVTLMTFKLTTIPKNLIWYEIR